MKNFRTLDIAVDFYHLSAAQQLPGHLKDQLLRAASSIALNLAEGSGRFGTKDQKRFYHIAFGSLRECQAILVLGANDKEEINELADKLAAHIYKLIRS
jgi:four helix bundle protein